MAVKPAGFGSSIRPDSSIDGLPAAFRPNSEVAPCRSHPSTAAAGRVCAGSPPRRPGWPGRRSECRLPLTNTIGRWAPISRKHACSASPSMRGMRRSSTRQPRQVASKAARNSNAELKTAAASPTATTSSRMESRQASSSSTIKTVGSLTVPNFRSRPRRSARLCVGPCGIGQKGCSLTPARWSWIPPFSAVHPPLLADVVRDVERARVFCRFELSERISLVAKPGSMGRRPSFHDKARGCKG